MRKIAIFVLGVILAICFCEKVQDDVKKTSADIANAAQQAVELEYTTQEPSPSEVVRFNYAKLSSDKVKWSQNILHFDPSSVIRAPRCRGGIYRDNIFVKISFDCLTDESANYKVGCVIGRSRKVHLQPKNPMSRQNSFFGYGDDYTCIWELYAPLGQVDLRWFVWDLQKKEFIQEDARLLNIYDVD